MYICIYNVEVRRTFYNVVMNPSISILRLFLRRISLYILDAVCLGIVIYT